MIKYGLISETDARCLEKTIDFIFSNPEFLCEVENGKPYFINILEIGLYNCQTSIGLYEYLKTKKRLINYTGIDNQKDKEIIAPDWMNLIIGNSNEVYNQLEDNSQHLIFIDGNHSFPMVISDFFCYTPKVKVGAYLAFHDTGKHIKEFKDYQGFGSVRDADMYISVRKALSKIGLLETDNYHPILTNESDAGDNWELIFEEADINNEAGGVCVFKKLY